MRRGRGGPFLMALTVVALSLLGVRIVGANAYISVTFTLLPDADPLAVAAALAAHTEEAIYIDYKFVSSEPEAEHAAGSMRYEPAKYKSLADYSRLDVEPFARWPKAYQSVRGVVVKSEFDRLGPLTGVASTSWMYALENLVDTRTGAIHTGVLPQFFVPTYSELNTFELDGNRVITLFQNWETESSRAGISQVGATYRQALYVDEFNGTYFSTATNLLGIPNYTRVNSTLPEHYIGSRSNYFSGVEYAVASLHAERIVAGRNYQTQLAISPGSAATDNGVLLSSAGYRNCDNRVCVTWTDHYHFYRTPGIPLAIPGKEEVELEIRSVFLPGIARMEVTR